MQAFILNKLYMELQEKRVIYDDNFFVTKSNDYTLKINNTSDVATNKNYQAIGNLKEDKNYIFDSAYNPMYCTPSYAGCYRCVSSCDNCQGGCQTSCQNTCYNGCNSGCQSDCQGNCQGGCNSSCTASCQTGCNGSCNSACQNMDGCASCNASCNAECQTSTVGCPSNLFTSSMRICDDSNYGGCGKCNSNVSCTSYASSCASNCYLCYSMYGDDCVGCIAEYTCLIYVACSSSCMTCNASGYTCNGGCYNQLYKYTGDA